MLPRNLVFLAAAFLGGLSTVARAEEGNGLSHSEKISSSRFEVNLGYVKVSNSADNSSLSGVVGGVGMVYGFTDKFGIQGHLQQAFAISGFNSLFTSIEVGGSYALFGSLKRVNSTVSYHGAPVFVQADSTSDTLRIGLIANQYFLNGSSRVLGLAGVGAELKYDYVLTEQMGLSAGAKFSVASNGSNTITPLQISVGLLILMGP